jgi:hypothetical protein
MKGPIDSFWYEISNRFNRLPVWLPGTPMLVGDVGLFDERGWSQQTTLDALGIACSTGKEGEPIAYDYSSHDGAEIRIGLSAQDLPGAPAVPAGHVGLHIRFSRSGAFVLKADAVRVQRVADLAALDRQILDRYRANDWRREWIVVTEVVIGGPSVTIVSAGSGGEAVVDLGAGPSGAGLPGAACAVTMSSGLAASFVASAQTALMWRGRCVHDRRWRRKAVMNDRGGPRPERSDDRGNAGIADVEYPDDLPYAYYETGHRSPHPLLPGAPVGPSPG